MICETRLGTHEDIDKLFDQVAAVREALQKEGINATDINICSYVSLNNEITITDIAEGRDRAFRNHSVLRNEDQEFDAIVHSTNGDTQRPIGLLDQIIKTVANGP